LPALDIVAVVAIVLAGILVAVPGATSWLPWSTPPSCSVGLSGAAVSVTVQGQNAQAQCESMLNDPTGGGSLYLYSGGQEPAGASICQRTYEGDLVTVRDTGSNMYGSVLCADLDKLVRGEPLVTAPPVVQSVPTPADLVTSACALQVVGHDASVYATQDVCADFEAAYPPASAASWEDRASGVPPNGDSLVCEGTYEGADVQVWDSGFAYYGDDLCQRLGWSAR
jgi:hypothetical protein